MTSRLSLTVLVDNTAVMDLDLCGEAGLSFLLETGGKKILFDTGLSGLFLANAEKMGIPLRDLDFLVLSHGHLDHTGGLATLARHLGGCSAGREATPGPPPHRPSPLLLAERKERQGKRIGDERGGGPSGISRRTCLQNLSGLRMTLSSSGKSHGDLPSRRESRRNGSFTVLTGPLNRITCWMIRLSHFARRRESSSSPGARTRESVTSRSMRGRSAGNGRLPVSSAGSTCSHRIQNSSQRPGKYLNRLHINALHACHCTSLPAKRALADYCPVPEVGVGMKFAW